MGSRPRAILLDLDGTLADSLPIMRHAYRKFLGRFRVATTDAEFDSINGPPLPEVVRRLKITHRLKDTEESLVAKYFEIIERAYAGVAPSPGARDLLHKAKVNRCTVGIVTSNSAKRTHAWLEAAGLSHLIEFVVSGDDVQRGKPHPEPYLLASQRASCPTATIIAVEDSPQGARSAVEAGLRTYVLTNELGSTLVWPQGVESIPSLNRLVEQLW